MRKAPHCSSAWHFQACVCGHERQVHYDEDGVCRERLPPCGCIHFERSRIYPEIPHETIPVRGKGSKV